MMLRLQLSTSEHPHVLAERLQFRLAGRGMGAAARSRLGSALVDWHIAIVDPLLVHPLPAEPFFAGQRCRRV
jgi:hypothetical protein